MVFLHLNSDMDEPKWTPIISRPETRGGVRAAFGRVWFGFERGVLWRIGDRFSRLGPRGRVAAVGGPAFAAGIGVAVLAFAIGGGSGSSAPTETATVAIVKRSPAPAPAPAATATTTPEVTTPDPAAPKEPPAEPPAPTLHGATPVFTPPQGSSGKVGGRVGGKAGRSAAAPKTEATIKPTDAPAATAKIGATPEATASAAPAARPAAGTATAGKEASGGAATQLDGPPAGPNAIRVARDFAGAFVVYETAGVDSRVRRAFGNTATAELSHSLLKRPPRLPANVEVPQAKVVNVVPGPSQGKIFTVSVSLLRVGVTSELRLEMEQRKHDGWQVTNVLG